MTTTRHRDPDQSSGHGRGGSRAREDDHPSFLALDRAALGSHTAHLNRHLAECARCRAHVDRIADPGPLPRAARLRRAAVAERPAPRRVRLAGLVAAAAAAVIVAAVLVEREKPRPAELAQPSPPAPRYDTAKGGRAVGVYVRRGRRTFLWNGSEPVQPGDALRLKLVPDGMTQVHVFSEAQGARGGALALLHRAELAPDRDILLDAAWRVDGAGDREVLVVVLSRRPLSPTAARTAARAGRMGDDIWVARLILSKRPAQPGPSEATP